MAPPPKPSRRAIRGRRLCRPRPTRFPDVRNLKYASRHFARPCWISDEVLRQRLADNVTVALALRMPGAQ